MVLKDATSSSDSLSVNCLDDECQVHRDGDDVECGIINMEALITIAFHVRHVVITYGTLY